VLRSKIESALAELKQNRMPVSTAIGEWRAISSLPERFKDGRCLLFWEKQGPVVGRWCERSNDGIDRSFWSTGFASLPDGELMAIVDPLYWAEMAEPGLWPRNTPKTVA
jgi:hypothetical protein